MYRSGCEVNSQKVVRSRCSASPRCEVVAGQILGDGVPEINQRVAAIQLGVSDNWAGFGFPHFPQVESHIYSDDVSEHFNKVSIGVKTEHSMAGWGHWVPVQHTELVKMCPR